MDENYDVFCTDAYFEQWAELIQDLHIQYQSPVLKQGKLSAIHLAL